jgi:hypothetical protein
MDPTAGLDGEKLKILNLLGLELWSVCSTARGQSLDRPRYRGSLLPLITANDIEIGLINSSLSRKTAPHCVSPLFKHVYLRCCKWVSCRQLCIQIFLSSSRQLRRPTPWEPAALTQNVCRTSAAGASLWTSLTHLLPATLEYCKGYTAPGCSLHAAQSHCCCTASRDKLRAPLWFLCARSLVSLEARQPFSLLEFRDKNRQVKSCLFWRVCLYACWLYNVIWNTLKIATVISSAQVRKSVWNAVSSDSHGKQAVWPSVPGLMPWPVWEDACSCCCKSYIRS